MGMPPNDLATDFIIAQARMEEAMREAALEEQQESGQDTCDNRPPGFHPGSRERIGRKSKAHRPKSTRQVEKKMKKLSKKRNRK